MLALSPQIILNELCFQCLQCVNPALNGQFRFVKLSLPLEGKGDRVSGG